MINKKEKTEKENKMNDCLIRNESINTESTNQHSNNQISRGARIFNVLENNPKMERAINFETAFLEFL